jgi:hypothetical protein
MRARESVRESVPSEGRIAHNPPPAPTTSEPVRRTPSVHVPAAPPSAPERPSPPGGAPSSGKTPILESVTLDFSSELGAAEDADHDRSTPEIDLEVTYASESNFYSDVTGADVGLFVATYVVKPVGTPLAVRLTLPQIDEPIVVSGAVHWVREFSPSIEAPPGMGLALTHLPASHRSVIDAFMKVRAPILHDA